MMDVPAQRRIIAASVGSSSWWGLCNILVTAGVGLLLIIVGIILAIIFGGCGGGTPFVSTTIAPVCDSQHECPKPRMMNFTQLSSWNDTSDFWVSHRICWMHRCYYKLWFHLDAYDPAELGFGQVSAYSDGTVPDYSAANFTYPDAILFASSGAIERFEREVWDDPISMVCLNFIHYSERVNYHVHLSLYDHDDTELIMACLYTRKNYQGPVLTNTHMFPVQKY